MATSSPIDQLTKYLISIDVNKVQMQRKQSSANQQLVEDLLNRLITVMKNSDDLFKDLYQHNVYAGSYWDGLRVKNATEFDVLMVLRLPFKSINVTTPAPAPAYLQYQLSGSVADLLSRNNPTKWTFQQKLIDFFDDKLLKRTEVQRWLQGLITKAMNSPHFQKPKNIKTIKPSQSGPAFTYYITTIDGTQIDVDLVPVIDGSCYPIPKVIHKSDRFNRLKEDYQKLWFMVPKPYLTSGADKPDTYWRIAFTEAEKNLLPTDGYVKTLIKLFKLLRDTQKWDKIASYYIKTLFLLELDTNSDPVKWKQDQIGTQFMIMLNKLKLALETKQLSYYFNRSANLLADMDSSTASNYAHRIEKIIKDISVKPERILFYYE